MVVELVELEDDGPYGFGLCDSGVDASSDGPNGRRFPQLPTSVVGSPCEETTSLPQSMYWAR